MSDESNPAKPPSKKLPKATALAPPAKKRSAASKPAAKPTVAAPIVSAEPASMTERQQKVPINPLPLIIGGTVLGLLLVGGLVFAFLPSGDDEGEVDNPQGQSVAANTNDDDSKRESNGKTNADETAQPDAGSSSNNDQSAENSNKEPVEPVVSTNDDFDISGIDFDNPIDVADVVANDPEPSDGIDRSKYMIVSDRIGFADLLNSPDKPAFEPTADAPPPPQQRRQPPNPDSVARLNKHIDTAFNVPADATPQQKLGVAKRLFTAGRHAAGEATTYYAMLSRTVDLAAEAGDLALAARVIDELEAQFEIDAAARKLALVDAVSQSPAATEETKRNLLAASAALVDELFAANEYAEAARVSQQLIELADDLGDTAAKQRLETVRRRGTTLLAMYKQSQGALAKLQQDRTNPRANHVAGSYVTFIQGDWEHGPKLLQYSPDANLAKYAKAELFGPSKPEQQLKMANAWRDYLAAAQGEFRPEVRARAAFWYKTAIDGLSGGDLLTARQRLEEMQRTQ